jgi:hypothetical protein
LYCLAVPLTMVVSSFLFILGILLLYFASHISLADPPRGTGAGLRHLSGDALAAGEGGR